MSFHNVVLGLFPVLILFGILTILDYTQGSNYMWFNRDGNKELVAKLNTAIEDRNNAWEYAGSLKQQASEARQEADRMKRAYTEEGLNEIALVTAKRIEDLFVSNWAGGRDARLVATQAILREVMRANLTGATYWKGPGEPSYSPKTEPPPPDDKRGISGGEK